MVGQYRIAPIPQAGSVIELEYRSSIEPGSDDTTSIRLFDLKPELVEYGALRIAADDSEDDLALARYTSEYNSHFLELQALALRDDFQNASMAPAYNMNGDWY
ncbi:hypothetical protein [Methylorubrum aminovorans]|uniref:hypothetical protein n=1 Tax=Methylorubrum aminovorans TaxID=269069 RepID=UPI003D67F038